MPGTRRTARTTKASQVVKPTYKRRPGTATRYERTLEKAERDRDMAEYKAGRTYQQVADHFGVSKKTAWESVDRAIVATAAIGGDIARAAELVKLDAMETACWAVLRRRHITISHGRVVESPETGEPLEDDEPVLRATATLLRVAERRAKLMGLDAPSRQTVTVVTEDVIDAEIARLTAELETTDAASAGRSPAREGPPAR